MYYLIIFILIAADQIIKIVVRNTFEIGQGFNVLGDFFQITYIENTGMAFGMMAGKSAFLILMPIVLLAGVWIFWKKYRKEYKMLFTISTAMVIAGGLSNLIDRVLFKSVTDYLDLQGFAVFNFADICATVGCVLLCFSIWFLEKKENKD
ncbi:MAG: signal peptidase II [Eubacterium sp.]|nr:signal peptidase II [Eubacterium sp.]